MRQYRIVTDYDLGYVIQYKFLGFIWLNFKVYYGMFDASHAVTKHFDVLKDAQTYVHNLVEENEKEAIHKKNRQAFKSKVVYGPYP